MGTRSAFICCSSIASTLLLVGALATGVAAQGKGKGGPGQPPPTGEEAGSNISFPIILSDNASPAGFPLDGPWKFATIMTPETECVLQSNTLPAVDSTIPCYYGQHVSVVSETGEITFDGPTKVWWLQKRPANFWKALTVAHDIATPLSVSAVDLGDLLESTPSIATRQIRTEFNLLQNVPVGDTEFGAFLVSTEDWGATVPAPCVIPAIAGQNTNCFAAVAMSGAVPGTEQSGNEAQGTDFGPGTGTWPGTQTFVDPTTVRAAAPPVGDGDPIPIHALVYSHCARFLIQKIAGTPMWDPTIGQWTGAAVGTPVVNVSAYGGTYSTEINSGGGLVYGYNWNAKTLATGTYRLTFVLDGNDDEGPACTTTLATEFTSGVTKLVNIGENNTPHLLYAGDSQLGDEGGLVYIDIPLTTKGGGKKGGGKK